MTSEQLEFAIPILLCVVIIVVTISLIHKLIGLAIGFAIAGFTVFIIFTVFWGDGTAYVFQFAEFLPPAYEDNLKNWYIEFKQLESASPILNIDHITDTTSKEVTNIFSGFYNIIKATS